MLKTRKNAASRAKRLFAAAAVPALSVLALSLTPLPDAQALYIVSNDAYVQVDEMAGDVFVTDSSASLVSRKGGSELALTPGQAVSVIYQNSVPVSATTKQETVTELLQRLNIQPSPLEMVSVAFLDDCLEIRVQSEFVFYEKVSSPVAHETIYQYNDKKPEGQETVLQEGCDGEHQEVYEIIYQDGEEASRQLIDVVDVGVTPTIIEVGTKAKPASANLVNPTGGAVAAINTGANGSGSITLADGQVLSFREARVMRGTAYTTGGSVGTLTASGTQVRVGVVAVDRNVLPLGTKVYVISNDGKYIYGLAVAEDTGVHGNTIDLYMNTSSECYQFGVRDCTVYVLD